MNNKRNEKIFLTTKQKNNNNNSDRWIIAQSYLFFLSIDKSNENKNKNMNSFDIALRKFSFNMMYNTIKYWHTHAERHRKLNLTSLRIFSTENDFFLSRSTEEAVFFFSVEIVTETNYES